MQYKNYYRNISAAKMTKNKYIAFLNFDFVKSPSVHRLVNLHKTKFKLLVFFILITYIVLLYPGRKYTFAPGSKTGMWYFRTGYGEKQYMHHGRNIGQATSRPWLRCQFTQAVDCPSFYLPIGRCVIYYYFTSLCLTTT